MPKNQKNVVHQRFFEFISSDKYGVIVIPYIQHEKSFQKFEIFILIIAQLQDHKISTTRLKQKFYTRFNLIKLHKNMT